MAACGWTTVQLIWRESTDTYHARDPFPPGGAVEDPATGAAAAAFGGYDQPHRNMLRSREANARAIPPQPPSANPDPRSAQHSHRCNIGRQGTRQLGGAAMVKPIVRRRGRGRLTQGGRRSPLTGGSDPSGFTRIQHSRLWLRERSVNSPLDPRLSTETRSVSLSVGEGDAELSGRGSFALRMVRRSAAVRRCCSAGCSLMTTRYQRTRTARQSSGPLVAVGVPAGRVAIRLASRRSRPAPRGSP